MCRRRRARCTFSFPDYRLAAATATRPARPATAFANVPSFLSTIFRLRRRASATQKNVHFLRRNCANSSKYYFATNLFEKRSSRVPMLGRMNFVVASIRRQVQLHFAQLTGRRSRFVAVFGQNIQIASEPFSIR